MAVSKFKVAQALESMASLKGIVNDLTEEEVLACLKLEAAAQRRASILTRLISRAARLKEISYVDDLKKKFLG